MYIYRYIYTHCQHVLYLCALHLCMQYMCVLYKSTQMYMLTTFIYPWLMDQGTTNMRLDLRLLRIHCIHMYKFILYASIWVFEFMLWGSVCKVGVIRFRRQNVSCRDCGYAIGVQGWGTRSQSSGFEDSKLGNAQPHRSPGTYKIHNPMYKPRAHV